MCVRTNILGTYFKMMNLLSFQRLLNTFVNKLFTPKSFEGDFVLVDDLDGIKGKHILMPDGVRREQFVQFVDNMEGSQTPSWLGLPNNAEKVLLTTQG